MSAPVRIEAEAWSDLRFATLARILELGAPDYALIRTARIWSWQAEHYTPEAPTYVVDLDTIESALGPGGAAALVRARLADEVPGGYRMRGAEGRIEWLWQRRQASRAGGEATKRKSRNKTGPLGQPLGQPGLGPKVSPLVSALVPVPEDQNPPPAHAIPPSPEPAPPPHQDVTLRASPAPVPRPAQTFAARDLAKLRAIGDLAQATWQRLSELRMQHAAKLKLEGVLPLTPITPGHQPRAFDELRERIRAEGDNARETCDHVLRVLDEQAAADKSIEWLSDKAFLDRPWSKARETVLQRKHPARAGPKAAPATVAISDAERAEVAAIAAEARKQLFNTEPTPTRKAT